MTFPLCQSGPEICQKKETFLLISGQVNDLNRPVSWFGGRYPVQLNGVKTRSKPHKLLFMPNFNSQEGVPVKTARFLWALRFFTHNFKTFTTNFLLNGFSSFLRCPMFSIFMVPCDDGDGHNHCSDDCDHQYRIQKTMWFERLVQVYHRIWGKRSQIDQYWVLDIEEGLVSPWYMTNVHLNGARLFYPVYFI